MGGGCCLATDKVLLQETMVQSGEKQQQQGGDREILWGTSEGAKTVHKTKRTKTTQNLYHYLKPGSKVKAAIGPVTQM